jgi:hypothetical protein
MLRKMLLAVLLAAVAVPSFSQTNTAAGIQQRKVNQQKRIANGAKTGELTPRETANLEHKEKALNREERRMRARDGGHLTHADKAKLARQQNRLSRDIYAKKHNDRTR